MIEVHRIKSKENEIVMQMTEGENVLCEACAKIEEDIAVLEYIDEKIPNVAYDMGKSILNAIDLAGIKEVRCNNENLANVLKYLRFKLEENTYILNLTNYFSTNCKKI